MIKIDKNGEINVESFLRELVIDNNLNDFMYFGYLINSKSFYSTFLYLIRLSEIVLKQSNNGKVRIGKKIITLYEGKK